jgi:hypothetical protein
MSRILFVIMLRHYAECRGALKYKTSLERLKNIQDPLINLRLVLWQH